MISAFLEALGADGQLVRRRFADIAARRREA